MSHEKRGFVNRQEEYIHHIHDDDLIFLRLTLRCGDLKSREIQNIIARIYNSSLENAGSHQHLKLKTM